MTATTTERLFRWYLSSTMAFVLIVAAAGVAAATEESVGAARNELVRQQLRPRSSLVR
jgi:hypothetical protein